MLGTPKNAPNTKFFVDAFGLDSFLTEDCMPRVLGVTSQILTEGLYRLSYPLVTAVLVVVVVAAGSSSSSSSSREQ